MAEKSNEKEYIKILKERDIPMPMGRYIWQTERFKNDPPADTCGKCDKVIGDLGDFCPWCGQRIDRTNYKI